MRLEVNLKNKLRSGNNPRKKRQAGCEYCKGTDVNSRVHDTCIIRAGQAISGDQNRQFTFYQRKLILDIRQELGTGW